VESWDTLKTAETLLPKDRFFRIGKSAIVNLLAIKVVDGDTVQVGDAVLSIGRARKKDFWAALQAALGR
ncbi:MAG: LytTR family transcriptional regulator DNA-binding domain-containing protein, partial [Clostridia bacterium]|nr:LytTR family transcriptional regulator DNA-binding domain-containing protein [Clostridia bacterium]